MKRWDEELFARSKESWKTISPSDFVGFLRPKLKDVVSWPELEARLKEGRKLSVKFGIDPTAKDVHLGHLVPIMVLRQFLKAGHKISLIIGDFTARVGDPSGRTSARKALSEKDIKENQKTYLSQIGKFIDIKKIKTSHNSQWLSKMDLSKWFSIIQQVPLTDATQREDFRERMKNESGVTLAEACYGVLMAADSLQVKADVEVGGVDQLLNFQQCRLVMNKMGFKPEVAVTTPILEGTSGDGRKMSKSFDNYIAATASPSEKFGKIMSIPDSQIEQYFSYFGDVAEKELAELRSFINKNPLEAKKQVACLLIAIGDGGMKVALSAREEWERIFSKHDISSQDCFALEAGKAFDVLFASGKFESKSYLRRLFEQKAIRKIKKNKEEAVLGLEDAIESGDLVRAGKKDYFRAK